MTDEEWKQKDAARKAKNAEKMRIWRKQNPPSPEKKAKEAERARKWREANRDKKQGSLPGMGGETAREDLIRQGRQFNYPATWHRQCISPNPQQPNESLIQMDRPNLLVVDDIRDTLVTVRDKASHEGYGLLAHLIKEAFEEAEKIRAIINGVDELRKPKKKARKKGRGIKY